MPGTTAVAQSPLDQRPGDDDEQGRAARAPTATPTMNVGIPLPVLSRPRPTHSALSSAGLLDCSRRAAAYMKRQMTDAPTSEIASGMKISDLASFSFFDAVGEHGDGQAHRGRGEDDGDDPPQVVDDRAAEARERGEGDEQDADRAAAPPSGCRSRRRWPVRCLAIDADDDGDRRAATTPMKNSRLVNMFVQLVGFQLVLSVNVSV